MKNNSVSINHRPARTAIPMAASKVGLQYQKSDTFNDDGEGSWCKYVCGFPEPRTYREKYQEWRKAINRKMEQDRIPGQQGSTAAQWAAIQGYALGTPPVKVMAALWQTDTARGERFTKCLDFLLKDIAKKHKPSLTRLLAGQPVPTVGPVAGPRAAPVAVGNDRKLPQTIRIECAHYMLIWLLQASSACAPSRVGPDSPPPAKLDKIQW